MDVKKDSKYRSAILAMTALYTGAAFSLSGCSTPTKEIVEARHKCESLQDVVISSSEFGLPTGSATVSEAQLEPGSSKKGNGGYCKLRGYIDAVNSGDLPIKFQVNLPLTWNGKSIQYGGGGSNGVVVEGTGNFTHAPTDSPIPLMQGYATYGGDSGHTTKDKDWVMNSQAYANFSGESVKRTHDAAIALIKRYYGNAPRRNYFIGGSKGGQEGLVAAQRYGADYDGVISFYPAARAFAMQMAWGRMGYAAQEPGAALNQAQQQFVKAKVLAVCDKLDGVEDGLVGRVDECKNRFSLDSLRCPIGLDASDTCLSNQQIKGLQVAATPLIFQFPLANGVKSIGPFPVLEGADFGWVLYPPKWAPWGNLFVGAGDDVARQVTRDSSMTMPAFDYRNYRERVQSLSKIYDASSTDLERFRQGGGKLLLIQGTTDMLVPHTMTTEYYHSLQSRYGANLDNFVSYYLQPGFDHGAGDFTLSVDSLTALDNWVENGQAPGDLHAIDAAKKTKGRTRPLCKYPYWAKYQGSGDVNNATSFKCVTQ